METTNNVRQLSIDNNLSQAWGLTKKHFLVFLLLMIIILIIGGIPSGIQYVDYMKVLATTGDPALAQQILMETAAPKIYLILEKLSLNDDLNFALLFQSQNNQCLGISNKCFYTSALRLLDYFLL